VPVVSQRGQRDHQIAALALWLRAQRAWQAQQLKPRITRTGWLLGAAEGLILAGLRAYAEDVVGILERVLPECLAREPHNPFVAALAPLVIAQDTQLRVSAA
jgi:hypothetical protein